MIQGTRSMSLSYGKDVLQSFRNGWHAEETVVFIDSRKNGHDHRIRATIRAASRYSDSGARRAMRSFARAGRTAAKGLRDFRRRIRRSRSAKKQHARWV